MNPKPPIDLREIVWRSRRYIWVALLPFVLALCAGLIFMTLATPLYMSYVTVALEDPTRVSAALEPLVREERSRDSRAQRTAELDGRVHSRPFLQSVVTRMGLNSTPEVLSIAALAVRRWPGISAEEFATRKAISAITKSIAVAPVGRTYVRVSATASDPEFAQALALAISSLLQEENRRKSLEQSAARSDFSEDQIPVFEENVRKAEEALRRFQERIIGRQLGDNPVTPANLAAARVEVRRADEEIDLLRGRLNLARGDWTEVAGGTSAAPPTLSSRRASDLESQLRDLETAYGESAIKGGDVASVKLRIGTVRQALYAEYSALAEVVVAELSPSSREAAAGIALDRATLRTLQEKSRKLSDYISNFSRTAHSAPGEQMELERLRGEVETNRNLLLTLRKEATSSRMSQALELSPLGSRLQIVETPQLPLAPYFPKRKDVLLLSLLAGSALAAGLVFAMEKFASSLRTVEQLERAMGIKVIATIPRIEGWPRPGSFTHNHWAALSIAAVLLLTLTFYGIHATLQTDRRPPGGAPTTTK